jgi:hypothetical protein
MSSAVEKLFATGLATEVSQEMKGILTILPHLRIASDIKARMLIDFEGELTLTDMLALSFAVEQISVSWRVATMMDLFDTIVFTNPKLAEEVPVIAFGGIGECVQSTCLHMKLFEDGWIHMWHGLPCGVRILLIHEP